MRKISRCSAPLAAVLVLTMAGTAAAVVPVQTGPIGWLNQVGTVEGDHAEAMAAGPSSGVYVGGTTDGTFPGQTPTAGADCLVSRFDKLGNVVWHRQIGTDSYCDVYGLASSSNGDVVAAITANGTIDSTPTTSEDGLVAKFDKNGTRKWTRRPTSTGGDGFVAAAIAPSGNIYLTGNADGTIEGQTAAGADVMVAKYDRNGNLKWLKLFGTAAADSGAGIAVGPGEDVYVVGSSQGDFAGAGYLGGTDGFVLKLDKNGNEKARVRLATNADDVPNAVTLTKQDGLRVVGRTSAKIGVASHQGATDGFIAALGFDLSVTWITQFGTAGFDSYESVSLVKGVAYVVGDTSASLFGPNQGADDAFVIKYDSLGNVSSGRQFGTAGAEDAAGLVLRSTNANGGALVVSMSTSGSAFGHVNAGANDVLVAALPK